MTKKKKKNTIKDKKMYIPLRKRSTHTRALTQKPSAHEPKLWTDGQTDGQRPMITISSGRFRPRGKNGRGRGGVTIYIVEKHKEENTKKRDRGPNKTGLITKTLPGNK